MKLSDWVTFSLEVSGVSSEVSRGGGGGILAIGGGGGNRFGLDLAEGTGRAPRGGGGGRLGATTCILLGRYSKITVA
jgi:hypothetical protein